MTLYLDQLQKIRGKVEYSTTEIDGKVVSFIPLIYKV